MSYQLKIEIQSYWHAGTGRGQGSDVDALAHRDVDGIPCLPGKTVKGLLRDAVTRWQAFLPPEEAGEFPLVEQLFGKAPDQESVNNDRPKPFMEGFGLLRVSDARLAEKECVHLRANTELTAGLFRNLHATKINADTGTAEDKSLRGIEVVVPLTLYAEIMEVPGAAAVEGWQEKLKPTLSLISAVGAHRTRGLGRAVVTLEEKS